MSDQYRGFVVTLHEDCSDERGKAIEVAIQVLFGYQATVKPMVADIDSLMAETRVRMELQKKIYEALR